MALIKVNTTRQKPGLQRSSPTTQVNTMNKYLAKSKSHFVKCCAPLHQMIDYKHISYLHFLNFDMFGFRAF